MVSTLMHLVWGYVIGSVVGVEDLASFILLCIVLDLDFSMGIITRDLDSHRYYLHNIFSAGITILLLASIFPISQVLAAVFSHLLLDLFDGDGIPLLFPITRKRYLVKRITYKREFPIKLVWEGNPYFTFFSFSLFFLALLY